MVLYCLKRHCKYENFATVVSQSRNSNWAKQTKKTKKKQKTKNTFPQQFIFICVHFSKSSGGDGRHLNCSCRRWTAINCAAKLHWKWICARIVCLLTVFTIFTFLQFFMALLWRFLWLLCVRSFWKVWNLNLIVSRWCWNFRWCVSVWVGDKVW